MPAGKKIQGEVRGQTSEVANQMEAQHVYTWARPVRSDTVDAYVDQDYSNSWFGADPVLCMSQGRAGPFYDQHQHAFIRFDGFTNYPQAGAVITRAALYLTSAGSTNTNPQGGNIRYLTGPWGDTTTFASNAAGIGLPANVNIAWMDSAPLTLWASDQVRSADIESMDGQ